MSVSTPERGGAEQGKGPAIARTRAGRQSRIVELLSAHAVRSQSELAALLAAEGIETTQATLSRDLDELGAVKLRGPPRGGGGGCCGQERRTRGRGRRPVKTPPPAPRSHPPPPPPPPR